MVEIMNFSIGDQLAPVVSANSCEPVEMPVKEFLTHCMGPCSSTDSKYLKDWHFQSK